MIGHDHVCAELVMTRETLRRNDAATIRNRFTSEIQRTAARGVQMTIHPDERLTGRELVWRRIQTVRQTAMQMPRDQQPLAVRILVLLAAP